MSPPGGCAEGAGLEGVWLAGVGGKPLLWLLLPIAPRGAGISAGFWGAA